MGTSKCAHIQHLLNFARFYKMLLKIFTNPHKWQRSCCIKCLPAICGNLGFSILGRDADKPH